MRAVIYARYSSSKQDEDSVHAQIRACTEYAEKKGYDITNTYADEAVSGKASKTTSRMQYQKLLRDGDKKLFDIVLIHKYDRIARSLREHANLEKRLTDSGIALIATAQDFGLSSEAKIIKSMMWALSEFYLDNLSSEVKKGHKEVALKGLFNGGYPPFGYDVIEQQYVVNEHEAVYVRKMFDCASHLRGFAELVEEMEQAGITGKRGRSIKYPQIYEILRNEKYTGVYTYSMTEENDRSLRRSKPNAIKIENALPTIIDRALFNEVQIIMNTRKQTGTKAGNLCSGLVYCGNCGAKMHGTATHRKGHEYRIYYCSKKCGIGTVSMESIDETVKEYLNELLSSENLALINKTLKEYAGDEKSRVTNFNTKIRLQVEEKQKQIDNYMSALGSGVLPAEVVADIGQKILSLKEELKTLKETPIPKDYTTAQITAWLESLKKSIDERSTVEMLVERIDATKTAVSVKSTLATVLGDNGCGGRI